MQGFQSGAEIMTATLVNKAPLIESVRKLLCLYDISRKEKKRYASFSNNKWPNQTSRFTNSGKAIIAGVISKNCNKGALSAMSESGCGPLAATPIFLKMET